MVDLDALNLSELLLLAQENNPNAHIGLGRKLLERLARGEDLELPPRPIDKTRRVLMNYILDHWTQVRPLLTCPAKSQDPDSCFRCTDVQVVDCALSNKEIFNKNKKDP